MGGEKGRKRAEKATKKCFGGKLYAAKNSFMRGTSLF